MLSSALHHAVCFTDDEGAVAAALVAVLGLRPVTAGAVGPSRAFSWEAGGAAPIGVILGAGAAGTIEVVPLPAELRGRLTPATTSISFAVDDLEDRVAACRAAGLAVRGGIGAGDLPYGVV